MFKILSMLEVEGNYFNYGKGEEHLQKTYIADIILIGKRPNAFPKD